jgi:hypothetical protein
MPHFTRTTRRRITFSVVAAFILVIAWNKSAEVIGVAPPGYCAIKNADGTSQLSVDDTIQYFDAQLDADKTFSQESVSCTYWPAFGFEKEELNDVGLSPRAMAMWKAVKETFGKVPYGGFEPGGVTTGHKPGSAHYEGRAIDFFFKPYTDKQEKVSGWQLAQWAVVHADELHIATVIYDDRIWSRSDSYRGWHFFEPSYGDKTNPTIRHLDHVHIDVN